MFRIKRLYTFMLQSFLPVFCMTYFICVFIILMQFLWKLVDDMVGKGIELGVLLEFFFYAALTFTPMALPLAILLASLMTFGNLSERLELLAMKAAGISLIRIMRPLIIVVGIISVGAFFFQNEVLPRAQVKMYTLMLSIRNKSPELDIPEGAFYKEIDGFNVYVKSKNFETGVLYDMMIYDFSRSFEDATVILADSGKLTMADDKTHLTLTLWSGESFDNLKDQRSTSTNVPYRRESFSLKELIIEFDANFNRMDDSFLSNQYLGKNMRSLRTSIDSLNYRSDSVADTYARTLTKTAYFRGIMNNAQTDTVFMEEEITVPAENPYEVIDRSSLRDKKEIYEKAVSKANYIKQDFDFKQTMQEDEHKVIRRHGIEIHKKFTLSIACIIFFFIGAPLGAIIGKGGLGVPVILSVVLFILHYIVDTTGMKMARDGNVAIYQGMWLSTFVFLPLGIFFTVKALRDSVLFNWDVVVEMVQSFFGLRKQRSFQRKDVIVEPINQEEFVASLQKMNHDSESYLKESKLKRSRNFFNFYRDRYQPTGLEELVTQYNLILEQGSNAEEQQVLNLLSELPVLYKMRFGSPATGKFSSIALACLIPFSVPYYILSMWKRRVREKSLQKIVEVNNQIIATLVEKEQTI